MKPLSGYEKAQAYIDTERLPVGGYVLKILDVEYQDNSSKGYNDKIILSFDISEGEQKDFYKTNYKAQAGEDKKWKGKFWNFRVPKDDGTEQDSWTMRRFKTIISAFEESNKGFHWDWDEKKLKGLLIGALFNNKEFESDNGTRGFYTNCHSLVTVEKIRSGKFEIPADTFLKGNNQQNSGYGKPDADGFMNIPDGIDEELPFN